MAKAWTVKEVKRCADCYKYGGMPLARTIVCRSDNAIEVKMRKIGVTVNKERKYCGKPRKWFAETIAEIFEMIASGLPPSTVAEYFNSTTNSIEAVIHCAKKNGFDAYPMRNK